MILVSYADTKMFHNGYIYIRQQIGFIQVKQRKGQILV